MDSESEKSSPSSIQAVHDHNYCTRCDLLSPIIPRPPYGGRYCSVVGCHNSVYRDVPRLKFHKFPRNEARRFLWEKAVNRSIPGKPSQLWKAKPHDVICSEHFSGGLKTDDETSPGYIPSIFPTHTAKTPTESDKKRVQRLQQRRARIASLKAVDSGETKAPVPLTTHEQEEDQEQDEGDELQIIEDDVPMEEEPSYQASGDDTGVEALADSAFMDHHSSAITMDYKIQVSLPSISLNTPMHLDACYCGFTSCDNEKTTQMTSTVQLHVKVKEKSSQTDKLQVLPFSSFTLRQFKSFTGVEKNFVDFLTYRVSEHLSDGKNFPKNLKVTLLLVKLKLNVTFSVLAAMFDLSDVTVIKYFYETLDIVAEEARKNIIWFDRDTIKTRMPKSFKKNFPAARAIIDCTEIETEKPSDVRENVLSYSNYKSKHTLKVLIAVAPSGEITFVSKTFGGRTSDTEITVSSGFLKLIEPGDVILADKGFPSIESSLNQSGCILVMPPFKRGNVQFSQKQNDEGYNCSTVRIHVERAIERIKRFEMLSFVPANSRKNIDKVLQIVTFIVNCYNDLIQDS